MKVVAPKKKTILLVEDDSTSNRLYSTFLKDEGYKVVSASSFEQGLNQITNNNFHLVITDIRLGDGSGIHLAELLKETQPETGIIIISGNTEFLSGKSSNERLLLNGLADICLKKPFNLGHLRNMIEYVLWLRNRSLDERTQRVKILGQITHTKHIALVSTVITNRGNVERFDGTVIKNSDGTREDVAWVALDYPDRPTRNNITVVSLASCIGCIGRCLFCKSRFKPFKRVLSTEEMKDQILHALKSYHCRNIFPPGNRELDIYFACEGDPLVSNAANVFQLIREINEIKDLPISNFVITTIGNEKLLRTHWDDILTLPKTKWYWSFHHPDEEQRQKWMPATAGQDIRATRDIFAKVAQKTKTPVTIAMALVRGENDRAEHIARLKELFGDPKLFRIKVSAMVEGSLEGYPDTSYEDAVIFAKELQKSGINAYPVRIYGSDEHAGCGTTTV